MKNIRFYNEDAAYQTDKQHFSSLGGGAVVAYANDTDKTYYYEPNLIVGTASKEFTPTEYAFSGYTFTSPKFRVRYSGDALTSLSNAFNEKSSLASIDKWTVDTSNVTDISVM